MIVFKASIQIIKITMYEDEHMQVSSNYDEKISIKFKFFWNVDSLVGVRSTGWKPAHQKWK